MEGILLTVHGVHLLNYLVLYGHQHVEDLIPLKDVHIHRIEIIILRSSHITELSMFT